jgi:hypothetical protein
MEEGLLITKEAKRERNNGLLEGAGGKYAGWRSTEGV